MEKHPPQQQVDTFPNGNADVFIDTIDTSARSFNQFYRPDPFIDDFVSGTTVLPLFDSCDASSGGPPAILSIYQIKKTTLCFF